MQPFAATPVHTSTLHSLKLRPPESHKPLSSSLGHFAAHEPTGSSRKAVALGRDLHVDSVCAAHCVVRRVPMRRDLSVGRIAGGIVGFAVAIIFTEVVFRNANDTAPLGMTAILIVLGAFAGSRVALHFRKELP